MCQNNIYKYLLISACAFIFFGIFMIRSAWPNILILEIQTESSVKKLVIQSEEIEKIGIIESLVDTKVEITIASKYNSKLKKLTQENIGRKLNIIMGNNVLYSGTIYEPLKNGIVSLSCSSEQEVRSIIQKIGRVPDYHLKPTKEELEYAKTYTDPANNPWAIKSMDAELKGDYVKAEEYAKKAIESNPNEPLHYAGLGAIYYIQGKRKLALEQYQKAKKRIREHDIYKYPGIYLSLGELYAESGMYDNAVRSFQDLLSADFTNLKAHSGLAKVYEDIGKVELAIEEYSILLKSEDEYFIKWGAEGIERLEKQTRKGENK